MHSANIRPGSRPQFRSGASGATRDDPEDDPRNVDHELKWTTYGIVVWTGLVGAGIVMVTLLIVDLLSGHSAMWTPAVLGSALFLGEPLGSIGTFHPANHVPVILGYTLVHVFAFLGFASAASAGRVTWRNRTRFSALSVVMTAVLTFLGLEFFFWVLGGFLAWTVESDLDLASQLSAGWVAFANALAALGMTATLYVFTHRASESTDRPPPPLEQR